MDSLVRKAFFTGLVCLAVAPSLYAQTKEYRDRRFGVSVSLPVGWKWTGPKRWGDQESTTIFKEPRTHPELKLYVKLLRTPENLSPEEMEKKLLSEAEYKVGPASARRTQGLPAPRTHVSKKLGEKASRAELGVRVHASW
jgi:hypothetical protein